MATDRQRVFSIGAWSPALKSLLNSAVGECGCVVGVYEAWSGGSLAVVDVAHPRCSYAHRGGEKVSPPSPSLAALQRP